LPQAPSKHPSHRDAPAGHQARAGSVAVASAPTEPLAGSAVDPAAARLLRQVPQYQLHAPPAAVARPRPIRVHQAPRALAEPDQHRPPRTRSPQGQMPATALRANQTAQVDDTGSHRIRRTPGPLDRWAALHQNTARRGSRRPRLHGATTQRPRRRPIFPRGYPLSIFGAGELNFRVRDGNGCGLSARVTRIFMRYVVSM
jgi:hypothetical protein